MILSHFSKEPLSFSRYYVHNKVAPYREFVKPLGFWLSDESDKDHGWWGWCAVEKYHLEDLAHETKFQCDTSKWITLKSRCDIVGFTNTFKLPEDHPANFFGLDWPSVQKRYSGVLITPYNWESRLANDTMWYYGWDCASACVWDLETIAPVPF